MGGLWGADGILCTAAGFKIKAETAKSCHGEWQSLEQRSGSEVLGDIKQGWRSKKIINSPIPLLLKMSPSLSPLNTVAPTLDNVLIDIDSDPEVDQVAQDAEKVL